MKDKKYNLKVCCYNCNNLRVLNDHCEVKQAHIFKRELHNDYCKHYIERIPCYEAYEVCDIDKKSLIDMYWKYVNDFKTIESFAVYYSIDINKANRFICAGKALISENRI